MKITLGNGRLGKVLRISTAPLLTIAAFHLHFLVAQKPRPEAARNALGSLVATLSFRVGLCLLAAFRVYYVDVGD